jgi:putative inorganic carbon (HCO3(-)) transporter
MILLATLGLILLMGAVFWRRIEWGVYALLFALPFERIGSWPLNPVTDHPVVRMSQVVGAALVLAFAAQVLLRRRKLRLSRLYWPLAGFVVWAAIPVVTIGYRPLLYGYAALVFVAALVVVVANLVPEMKPARLLAALLAGAGVTAVFGLFQFVAGTLGASTAVTGLRPEYTKAVFGFPRIQSTGLEPLYYANYLLIPLLVLGKVLVFGAMKRARWWLAGLLLVLALTFVLTMSRGAFIGVVVGLAVTIPLALMKRKLLDLRLLGAVVGVAVVLAGAALMFASYRSDGTLTSGPKRFLSLITVDLTRTGSFTERTQMRDQATEIAKDHPVVGVGIEGISPYVLKYQPGTSETTDIAFNNQALELLDETGVPGGVLFYGFLAWLLALGVIAYLRTQDRMRSAWLLALLGALVAVTVQAQSFSGFLLTHLWVLYGLLAGLALAKPSRHQNMS